MSDQITFWLLAALLCGFVVLALNWRGNASSAQKTDGALAIYRDQLDEVSRDAAAGMLEPQEANALKTEVARRMLAEAKQAATTSSQTERKLPWLAALIVPALALPLYALSGAPQMPDVPRAERLAQSEKTGDMPALIARVEDHLAQSPRDLKGWQLLFPNYMRLQRYADAEAAMLKIMELDGDTADRLAEIAAVRLLQNKGLVNDGVEAAVAAALKLDPKHAKARFLAAMALAQNGKKAEAQSAYEALIKDVPPDTPWFEAAKTGILNLQVAKAPSAAAPELALEQLEEGMGLSPEERKAKIQDMVDGLEKRLAENGNDLEGWLRLIRSRAVLGERDKAALALADARARFATDQTALDALNDLASQADLK